MTNRQVIIVSGGSRGLGAAIVERLLAAGHTVATFSRKATPNIEQWQADASTQGRFHHDLLDAADADALHRFVDGVLDRFGRIDALVNNAALAHDGVLPMMDDETIDAMLNVNVKGPLRLTRACARQMLLRERGSIINIASVAAARGVAGLSVYSATKAALVGMTRSLARELGPRGIRVNAIAPGYLETDMSAELSAEDRARIIRRTPLGRLGKVGDVLPWIELLLSDEGSFVTGQVLTIDGGMSA